MDFMCLYIKWISDISFHWDKDSSSKIYHFPDSIYIITDTDHHKDAGNIKEGSTHISISS